MKNLKRVTALMLCVLMVLSSIPTAYAAGVKVDDFTKDVYNEWLAASKKAAAAEVTTMTAVGYTNKANVELYYNSFIGQLVGEFLKPAGVVSDAGTAMVIIGAGEGEWINEGYYRVRYNGNEYRVAKDDVTLCETAPECDCGNSEIPLTSHADSCAKKAYYHLIANLYTAEELAGVWDTFDADVAEHILEYLGWNDQVKLEVLMGLIIITVTESIYGDTIVSVTGGQNVVITEATVPDEAEALFPAIDTHWRLTFDLSVEDAPDGVEVEIGNLMLPEGTWANVYHFFDDVEEADEARKRNSAIYSKGGILYEILPASVDTKNGKVRFTAYSFSTYTVDFYKSAAMGYSIKGGSSINLSTLLEMLEYPIPMGIISDVEFTNPELLSIVKTDGDWVLKSLKAFRSEEYLYIKLTNGDIIEFFVLDSQTGASKLSGSKTALTKSKTAEEIADGEYEITVKVIGRSEEEDDNQKTDVILVLDITSSMGDSGIKNLNKAAKEFCKVLLNDKDSLARVAIIVFTDIASGNSRVISNNGASNFFTAADFINDNGASINRVIDQYVVYSNNNGATNIQNGMRMAENLLASAECQKNTPIVVLMTDGAPNRCLKLDKTQTNTVKYTFSESHGKNNHYGKGGTGITQISYSGTGGDDQAYYNTFPNESPLLYSSFEPTGLHFSNNECTGFTSVADGGKVIWTCKEHNVSNEYYGSAAIGMMEATMYEGFVLRTKAEVYTIGVDMKKWTKDLLQKVATSTSHYVDSGKTDVLVSTFSSIATRIKNSATDAVVTDPMSEYDTMEYSSDKAEYTNVLDEYISGKANIYINGGSGVTYNAATETLTWKIGVVPFGKEYIMRYKVKINDGVSGNDLPLNDTTTISYKDLAGNSISEEYDVPTVDIVIKTAEYTVKHLQQKPDGCGYEEVTEDEETKEGNIGELTAAEAKTYDGFKAQAFDQKTIAADGTTVVEIYYDRNKHNVTWKTMKDDDDAGYTVYAGPTEVRYGAAYPEQPVEVDYYSFGGWYKDEACTEKLLNTDVMPNENVTLYGKLTRKRADLTVEKKGMGDGEYAIITVTGDGKTYRTIVSGNRGSAVFADLKVGAEYTVSEESAWTWRYTATGTGSITIAEAPADNKVTIQNTKGNDYWLDGEARAHNVFNQSSN